MPYIRPCFKIKMIWNKKSYPHLSVIGVYETYLSIQSIFFFLNINTFNLNSVPLLFSAIQHWGLENDTVGRNQRGTNGNGLQKVRQRSQKFGQRNEAVGRLYRSAHSLY